MHVTEADDLAARQVYDVLELRNAVAAASGTSPLSDHVVAAIKGNAPGRHFLQTTEDGRIVGYASLDGETSPVAELLLGDGGDLLGLLHTVSAAAGPSLRIWTRGDTSPLNEVLPAHGFTTTRTLLQMRCRLRTTELPEPAWAEGIAVRAFRVGQDEEAWLAVNNAAFAAHPEQAGWTLEDIRAREEEAWFDPSGFFLAESAGRIVGFHWTKQHDASLGEVYVIGVDPSMQGKRLGEALLLEGMRHLRDRGLDTCLLYVEADNRGAIARYERHGFSRWDADRQFTKTPG